jgi:hypothetical protein
MHALEIALQVSERQLQRAIRARAANSQRQVRGSIFRIDAR